MLQFLSLADEKIVRQPEELAMERPMRREREIALIDCDDLKSLGELRWPAQFAEISP